MCFLNWFCLFSLSHKWSLSVNSIPAGFLLDISVVSLSCLVSPAHPDSTMSAPARFSPPKIQDNPNGWGPNSVPPQFKDMPYQPFSKSDRLGKVRGSRSHGEERSQFYTRVTFFRSLTGPATRTRTAAT